MQPVVEVGAGVGPFGTARTLAGAVGRADRVDLAETGGRQRLSSWFGPGQRAAAGFTPA
ncbi:hypothetical protein [Dactylosporangium sp. CA-139066]|uniref:hypothetical protein n=1 Tax=Dactylosporangium sp. CA-139066 TaxID=3239930 RepID=UPI003D8A7A02